MPSSSDCHVLSFYLKVSVLVTHLPRLYLVIEYIIAYIMLLPADL